jgi:hypothetical protein
MAGKEENNEGQMFTSQADASSRIPPANQASVPNHPIQRKLSVRLCWLSLLFPQFSRLWIGKVESHIVLGFRV